MTDTRPLWQWSATDLAHATTTGVLSAHDAVSAAVSQMRDVNGALNAVVDDLSDTALAEAEALDRGFAEHGPIGPLHGVPVTIKENIDQTGLATPNGVTAFRDVIAPGDSPVVSNLKNAGAVIIGRTNTPEFSFRATTVNELHGRTFSPWNMTVSSGGSSGGASSAVMSGMGALAHGNDIGGSLRFPAYCTGATTVKPGLGRVPAYNPSASVERGPLAQIMSVQGLIAREVRDVRLGMRALVAYDPHDPWQVPMPFDGPPVDGPLKIAFTKTAFGAELHTAVSQALDNAAEILSKAGYDVVEIEPPLVREAGEEAYKCLIGETLEMLGPQIREHGSEAINDYFDMNARLFEPYSGVDLQNAMARRAYFVRAWTTFLADWPLVVTPFLPTPPYAWDRDIQGEDGLMEVLGRAHYSYAMNFMGLPAGIIAASFDDGLPIGVQIVGRRWREDLILDALEVIESDVGVMADRLFERGINLP